MADTSSSAQTAQTHVSAPPTTVPIAESGAPQLVLNQSTGDVPYVSGNDNANWPSIISQSAVVMDMNTGTIVYGKNPLVSHYPASITKIMTALLALKLGKLTDTLTASADAVNQPPDKLYLKVGEQEQLEPLLYGMLLDSANDVAVEIAQHYGGTVANFAKMMNQEAVSLGATHTHFTNPNGLPDSQHVTTAYDMALIARAAMQYPTFRKIVDTKYYNWKGEAWQSRLSNLNSMLFYYPGTIGIKTGFTSVAQETIVVAAKRGEQTFLAVLMDCPTDAEIRTDAANLLDYAFSHYETQTLYKPGEVVGVVPGANGAVPLVTREQVVATVPKGHPLALQDSLNESLPNTTALADTGAGQLQVDTSSGTNLGTVPVYFNARWSPIVVAPRPHRHWMYMIGGVVFAVVGLAVRRRMVRRRRQREAAQLRQRAWGSYSIR